MDWNCTWSQSNHHGVVTPYAGVWIEIQRHLPYSLERMSLPTRECGLKYSVSPRIASCISHSLRGSVDWNLKRLTVIDWFPVTPYAGVWIEMNVKTGSISAGTSHSLRVSVDWNLTLHQLAILTIVTPYAGVWIEMLRKRWDYGDSSVTPYAGVWIEM